MTEAVSPLDPHPTHEDVARLAAWLGRPGSGMSRQTHQDLELPLISDWLAPGASSCARCTSLLLLQQPQAADPDQRDTPLPAPPALLRWLARLDVRTVLRATPDPVSGTLERVLPSMPWLVMALLVVAPLQPALWPLLLLTVLANLALAFRFKPMVEASCWREIITLAYLAKGNHFGSLANLWMAFDTAVRVDPTGLMELLRIALGLETAGYLRANVWLRDRPGEIAAWILLLGLRELAVRSHADTLLSTGPTCPGESLAVEELRHPLVDDCQLLSLACRARLLLINGDNMSGKSTLLRSLGLDVTLRLALGAGLSRSLTLPYPRVETVIHKADNRAVGESLFFRELRLTREALEALQAEGGVLLLDEPFSGTHRSIRHALTRAMVEDERHVRIRFVIATHDDQLVLPGAERLVLVVERDGDILRRRLRPGQVRHTDTTDLLRAAGWQESVIAAFGRHLSAITG